MTKDPTNETDLNEPFERRRAPRYVACFPAHLIRQAKDGAWLCVTHDLSRTGGLLFTQVKLQPGQTIDLELYLSWDTSNPTRTRGHVVRTARRMQPNTFWAWDTAIRFDTPIDDAEPQVRTVARRQERQSP
jgi:hypothetical protein